MLPPGTRLITQQEQQQIAQLMALHDELTQKHGFLLAHLAAILQQSGGTFSLTRESLQVPANPHINFKKNDDETVTITLVQPETEAPPPPPQPKLILPGHPAYNAPADAR